MLNGSRCTNIWTIGVKRKGCNLIFVIHKRFLVFSATFIEWYVSHTAIGLVRENFEVNWAAPCRLIQIFSRCLFLKVHLSKLSWMKIHLALSRHLYNEMLSGYSGLIDKNLGKHFFKNLLIDSFIDVINRCIFCGLGIYWWLGNRLLFRCRKKRFYSFLAITLYSQFNKVLNELYREVY